MTGSSVKQKWISFFTGDYTAAEWLCSKIAVVLFVGPGLIYTLFQRVDAPYPSGLCRLVNCNLPLIDPLRWVFVVFIALALLFYLLEIKMLYTTLALFVLSLLIYSIEESNGLKGRKGLLSLMFLSQFAAYLWHRYNNASDLFMNRVKFTVQLIAAAYALAAMSKLQASGLSWVADSPNVALQILKSFDYAYFDSGLIADRLKGEQMARFITDHLLLVKFLFSSALLLEMFSFVLLFRKSIAFIYSWLLLSMHIGILLVMDIFFPTISMPLVIFLINPFYIGYLIAFSIYRGANRWLFKNNSASN